jgi:hypothetical protein
MVLTLWCVTVVLGSLMLAGIPVAWLLRGRRPLTGADFLLAPFLGMAAIILICQNLVYLDIPLGWSAPCLWAAIGIAWFAFCRSGHARVSLRRCPWAVLAAAVAVYALQGLALFAVGAHDYSGRAWTDVFNYVTLAEFLKDTPFHTSWAEIGNRPWLTTALLFRWDRIGQSVLHSFFAVSAGSDARTLFGPTILLGPALTVLAMVLLTRSFGVRRPLALLVGTTAGLLPALTVVHVECFLSQALGLPMLLVFLVTVMRVGVKGSRTQFWTAAMLFAAAVSVYTEYWAIFQALIVVVCGLCLPRCRERRALILRLAALSVLGLALNLGAADGMPEIFKRVGGRGLLADLFPWANSVEGLSRLWTGEWVDSRRQILRTAARLLGLGATALGFLGLLKAWLDRWRCVRRRQAAVLAGCVAALALLPLLVFLKDDGHPYQFYKLLLTISPLLVLGLALLWQPLRVGPATAGQGRQWPSVALACASLVVVLCASGLSTGKMVWQTNRTLPHPRSLAHLLLTDDVCTARSLLEELPPSNLLLVTNDGYGSLYNSWFSYFGRRHRIWMANPEFIDIQFEEGAPDESRLKIGKVPMKALPSGLQVQQVPFPSVLDLKTLPGDALVLEQRVSGFDKVSRGDTTALWASSSFRLWKSTSGRWALPLRLETPYGIETVGESRFFWMGQATTTVEVLANCPGTIALSAAFVPGPALPSTSGCRLQVRTSGGVELEMVTTGGPKTLTLPVEAGRTTVWLTPLDRGVPPQPGGDPRTLLLGVHELAFVFTPK